MKVAGGHGLSSWGKSPAPTSLMTALMAVEVVTCISNNYDSWGFGCGVNMFWVRLVSNNSRSVLMHIELMQVLTVKMGELFSLSRLLARRSKQISMHFPMTISLFTLHFWHKLAFLKFLPWHCLQIIFFSSPVKEKLCATTCNRFHLLPVGFISVFLYFVLTNNYCSYSITVLTSYTFVTTDQQVDL